MISNKTLESTFGPMDFAIFQLSIWFKIYVFILWTFVVLSNACCFVYIYQKLNLFNIVNLIPLLDCTMNLIGFIMIGLSSANLWCNEIGITAACLLISGKYFHLNQQLAQQHLISEIISFLGHLTYCHLSLTRYVIVRNGHESKWVGVLKKSLIPSHLVSMIYWITVRTIHDKYIRSLNGALEVRYVLELSRYLSKFIFHSSFVYMEKPLQMHH